MHYVSPLNLIADLSKDLPYIKIQELKLFKKQRLLELQLNNGQISINGEDYSKDDVLKAFNELENESSFKFHLFIWKNPNLHHYLSKGEVQSLQLIQNIESLDNTYRDRISPFLVAHIKKATSSIFDRDFSGINRQIPLIEFLSDKDEVLGNIKYQLDYLSDKLNHLKAGKIKFLYNDFRIIVLKGFYDMLNQLPEEMEETVDDLASNIVNALISIEQEHLKFVKSAYNQLITLKCYPETMEVIAGNHGIYNSNSFKFDAFKIIGFIVMVLIFGGRMVRTCNRPSYNFNSTNQNDIFIEQFRKNTDFTLALRALKNEKELDSRRNSKSFYYYFAPPLPILGDFTIVDNQLPYDVRFLVRGNDRHHTSNIVKRNSKDSIPLIAGAFVIYMGNHWSNSHISSGFLRSITGSFTLIDSNTTHFLDHIYEDHYISPGTTISLKQEQDSIKVSFLQ